jgi:hypothetical protein
MSNRKLFKLDLKVKAVNAASTEANRLMPILLEMFKPFIGQKVELASGGLIKKIKDKLPEMAHSNTLRALVRCDTYSITLSIYASSWAKDPEADPRRGDDGQSFEDSCYIAKTNDGILNELYDWKPLRTNYTVDEIVKKREAVDAAKRALDTARSALYPFGESDPN